MANTYECPNPVRGLASRWTRADVCGRPLPRHLYLHLRVTTRAFVMAKFSMDLEKGTEIVQKRADGSLCVSDLGPDQLKRLTAEIQMCGMPVPLQQIALSMNAIIDPANPTHIIGASLASINQKAHVEATETLQVEMWQFNKNTAACAGTGSGAYVRHIFPLFRNRQISGDLEIDQSKATVLSVKGIVEETAAYTPSDPADPIMSNATNLATMRASGPWGYFVDSTLPTIQDCNYDTYGSGSG
jgi:hypothetical protein